MRKRLFLISLITMMASLLIVVRGSSCTISDVGGSVLGQIIDDRSGLPIEYANISIYSLLDSSLITGGITDAEGYFKIMSLHPGSYYATIKFIGYEMKTLDDITISRTDKVAKLGNISLVTDAQNLNELEVVADRQQVLFKIDKKIVNPSQFLAAQGGSAVDILANTPSVTVDIEGNVSMRGSSNFMVLVNGKPTPFDASDALAQIPASSIENIEIITNPSAKYDPDGAAGIINVITKKDAQMGWNGIVNATVNTLGSYTGNFLVNFAGDAVQWYLGGSRSDRLRSADYTNNSGTINVDTSSPNYGDTTHIAQDGERVMFFYSNSLKAGLDYNLNDKNTLGFELQGGVTGRNFDSDLDNQEWTTGGDKTLSYALAETRAKGKFLSSNLSQHTYFRNDKEHKLESSFFFQLYEGNDDTYSNKVDDAGDIIVRQVTWEDSESSELRLRTDYSRPWERGKIEAGYQLRIDDSWSNYDATFIPVEDSTSFYNEYSFYRMINSAYVTFSGETGQWGYQLGMRGEHTLRELKDFPNNNNGIKRWDFYPTVHLSYNLSEEQSFMTSYTRRIDRPRSYWLDPYVMWRDPNNVRIGNSNLQAQYIDSYELSYQLSFSEGNYLSGELFHRHVADKIERTRSMYQDGVIMMVFDNVGEDYSTGLEFMLNYNLSKWWTANLSGSVYDYRINVTSDFASTVRETQSNNYRGRLSNTFKPSSTLRIQFDVMYNSASVTATGTNSDVFFSSLAVKKSFFKRKLDVGISLIDCFDTAKMGMYGSGTSYYSDYYFDMKSPYLQFNLSYVLNNYKPERRKGGESSSSMGLDF